MWQGILGKSDTALPPETVGGPVTPTSPIVDAKADVMELATLTISATRLDGRDPQVGDRVECVADIDFGSYGAATRITVDILRGVTLSLGATWIRVSARNRGNVAQRVLAHVAPGSRPAAREAQLTTLGGPVLGGGSLEVQIPPYAVWMEVWRTNERGTELELDMAPPAPADPLFNVRASMGSRMPRMPIANAATRATIRNVAAGTAEPTDPVAVANAFTPTIIWGLCV